jgi:hypothetical protein
MWFQGSGLGFSASPSKSAQRHCYVKGSALDTLMDTPGVLAILLEELTGQSVEHTSVVDQMARLKRHVIHLSVTPSSFHGLSLEEIVVLTAYTSPRLQNSAFTCALNTEPNTAELRAVCERWLSQRATVVATGPSVGLRRWPLVGHSPQEQQASSRFVVGLAPFSHPATLERELGQLAGEATFGHEHYVACSPGTALAYLRQAAEERSPVRWDPFVLDRRLRSLGLGLLLVEGQNVALYMPARYTPAPVGQLSGNL